MQAIAHSDLLVPGHKAHKQAHAAAHKAPKAAEAHKVCYFLSSRLPTCLSARVFSSECKCASTRFWVILSHCLEYSRAFSSHSLGLARQPHRRDECVKSFCSSE